MGQYVTGFDKSLKATDKSRYHRDQYKSFMTGPEWFNVEISATFAQFLTEKKSMFQFPYFRQITEMWRVFYQSYKAARQYDSAYNILTSDYMIMDLFVVLFTTTEMTLKSLVAMMLYPFLSKENDTQMQQHLAEYFAFYAQDIEDKPFFQHDWVKYRNELAEKYQACTDRTWVDWFTWSSVSTEMRVKAWISAKLNSDFVEEASTTDILVKFKTSQTTDPEEAKNLFRAKLGATQVNIVDDQLFVKKQQSGKNYISVYARLTAPRYMGFDKAIFQLSEQNIHLRKIAGQDHVQVKCDLTAANELELNNKLKELSQTEHSKLLYTYRDGIHSNRQMCMFDVKVKNIDTTLKQIKSHEGTHIPFIHNF